MTEQRHPSTGYEVPNIRRADSGLVVVSQWNVAGHERQRSLADTLIDQTRLLPSPEGLLSASYLVSTDGERIVRYSQWTNEQAHGEFLETYRAALANRNAEVPEQPENVTYRLYRSGVRDGAPVPGCVVVVSVRFDGPDEQRIRSWVDAVFEAIYAEEMPHPGGISGHFHISTDAMRALNYAEWVDEAAHRDAIERGRGSVGTNHLWQRVRTFPGIVSSEFKRYHLYWSRARSSGLDGDRQGLLGSGATAPGA